MHGKKSEMRFDAEPLFRRLIEHMNEAVWVGDENELTVYANPKFCEIMEYSLSEMLGRPSYDFWDAESAERVLNVNKTKRKHGVTSSYEGTLVSKNGSKIPVLLSGAPLPNGGTIGIMTDLRELKKRDSLYRTLVERMNEAIWMGDSNEHTVYANPKFCELVGYSLEEMIGRESYEFWDEETKERVRQVNFQKRKKGLSSSYEGNLLTKNGQKIPVLVSGTPSPEGGTMGIITDLRELKQKEESEKILNTAIRYASDGIIIFDDKGEIKSWNKGAKIIFGYKSDEVIGMSVSRIFEGDDIEEVLKDEKIRYNLELTGVNKNKNPVSISATLTPIFSEDKHTITYCLLIARDITSQNKFEEELALKYEKLKQAYNQFGILRRQMDYIFELLDFFSENQDRRAMANYFVTSIIMLTRVDACVLRVYNEKKNSLELLSSFGVGRDWKGKATLKFSKSLAEKAFAKETPLKIIDVSKDSRYQSKHLAKKNNLCSLLLIPLHFRDKPVGTLSLYVSPDRKLALFENEFIEQYSKLIEFALGAL